MPCEQIFHVSIYNGIEMETETSSHGRFTIHPGVPNVWEILSAEANLREQQVAEGRTTTDAVQESSALDTSRTGMRNHGTGNNERTVVVGESILILGPA